jgi:hypothetical protein
VRPRGLPTVTARRSGTPTDWRWGSCSARPMRTPTGWSWPTPMGWVRPMQTLTGSARRTCWPTARASRRRSGPDRWSPGARPRTRRWGADRRRRPRPGAAPGAARCGGAGGDAVALDWPRCFLHRSSCAGAAGPSARIVADAARSPRSPRYRTGAVGSAPPHVPAPMTSPRAIRSSASGRNPPSPSPGPSNGKRSPSTSFGGCSTSSH